MYGHLRPQNCLQEPTALQKAEFTVSGFLFVIQTESDISVRSIGLMQTLHHFLYNY